MNRATRTLARLFAPAILFAALLRHAVTTGPLFSLTARGTIGKALTFSAWKGIGYARTRVVPANPKTTQQENTRGVFAWLSGFWRYAPAYVITAFTTAAIGRPQTNRNILAHLNVGPMRLDTTLVDFTMTPGAPGAPAPTSIGLGSAGDTVTATLGAPSVPAGWALVKGWATALVDADPHDPFDGFVVSNFDAAAPYAPTLACAAQHGATVRVWGAFEFTNELGDTVFSPSLDATIVVA